MEPGATRAPGADPVLRPTTDGRYPVSATADGADPVGHHRHRRPAQRPTRHRPARPTPLQVVAGHGPAPRARARAASRRPRSSVAAARRQRPDPAVHHHRDRVAPRCLNTALEVGGPLDAVRHPGVACGDVVAEPAERQSAAQFRRRLAADPDFRLDEAIALACNDAPAGHQHPRLRRDGRLPVATATIGRGRHLRTQACAIAPRPRRSGLRRDRSEQSGRPGGAGYGDDALRPSA